TGRLFGLTLLSGKLLQEFVHGRAEIFAEPADFLLCRTACDCFAQVSLGRAQVTLGCGKIAALDILGHFPEHTGNFQQLAIVLRRIEPVKSYPKPEINTSACAK